MISVYFSRSNLHRAESEKQQLSAQLKELEARVISLQQETDDLKLEYDKAVEARVCRWFSAGFSVIQALQGHVLFVFKL